jgi:gas vesicle protein
MKKRSKMKTTNKIVAGLLAGAAAGVLTFMFVKPKLAIKKKEEISNNLNLKEDKKPSADNLFI